MMALLKSIESFTTELHKKIADDEKGNFVCSGLSVHLVSSMCALGAQGNTAKEMLDTLHLNRDSFSSDFKNLIATHLEDIPDIELIAANRIFADKILQTKDSFKEQVRDSFLSDVIDVDFVSQREMAIEVINNWCAEKTKNKISELVSEDSLPDSTKMILANVVYFKALWSKPFEEINDEAFFVDKNTTISVPTMRLIDFFMYKDLTNLNAECIAIPYQNTDYNLVIIKPKEIDGLKQLEMNLEKFELDFSDKPRMCDVDFYEIYLSLPKFKIESHINLEQCLKKLGMIEMFDGAAEFEGISDRRPLFVAQVIQKALIDVDEKGTEATAATCDIMTDGVPRLFKVDRPFIYRIVKKSCNLTLFSGRVVRPMYN